MSVEEKKIRTVAEIVQHLIVAHNERKDVNLNALKTRIASKYGLQSSPRLVDIIAAVPVEFKKILVPKLLAKPIRTASGVSTFRVYNKNSTRLVTILDSCCSCNVQTAQMSSYQFHRKHMCLLPWWS